MKKWIAMLALVCAFCMIPTVSAKASGNPTPPGLYIDDVRCLLHEVKEGDGWNYDGDYTLTLDGTIVDSIYFQPYDENVLMGGMDRYVPTGLRIVLKGKNTVGVIRSDIGKFCTFVISGNGSMEMEQLWNAAYQFRGGDVTVAKYDEAVIRGMEVYPGASVTIGFSSSGGWIADYLDIMLYGGTLNVRNDYGDFRNVGKVNIYNGAKMIVNCPMKVGSASTILTDYHVTDAEGNAVVMEERDYHSISSYLVSAGQKEPANVLVFTRDEQKELPPDTSEQWNFRISEDGTLTKYVGQGFKAVIPEGVVRIDDRTFSALNLKKESGLRQVVLPSTIVSIGEEAFSWCKNLTEINFPEGLVSIGDYAFENCSSLTKLDFPDSISEIGEHAFSGTGLEQITLPQGEVLISPWAFAQCRSLVSASLSKGKIGESAFYGCDALAEIDFPEGITEIGADAFYECKSLDEIIIPSTVVYIGRGAFSKCYGLRKVTIREGDAELRMGSYVFDDRIQLASIILPKRVAEIEDSIGSSSFRDMGYEKADLVLTVTRGSYAEAFAKEKHHRYIYAGEEPEHTHSYISEVTAAPDCDFAGQRQYTCLECGDVYLEEIPALGHTYQQGQVIPASIGKDGSVANICTRCQRTESSTIPALTTACIRISKKTAAYSGKNQKPSVTVQDPTGKPLGSEDYTIVYPKTMKAVGTYTIVVEFKGNYTGSIQQAYTILPKGTSISKISAKKKGFALKWKKQASQTTGYEIAYATNSKFPKKSTRTVLVGKKKATSKTISKLKAKKKYYVRIRTYKKVKGKTYYSGWSKAKTVNTL